jgi:hypothetical protein
MQTITFLYSPKYQIPPSPKRVLQLRGNRRPSALQSPLPSNGVLRIKPLKGQKKKEAKEERTWITTDGDQLPCQLTRHKKKRALSHSYNMLIPQTNPVLFI